MLLAKLSACTLAEPRHLLEILSVMQLQGCPHSFPVLLKNRMDLSILVRQGLESGPGAWDRCLQQEPAVPQIPSMLPLQLLLFCSSLKQGNYSWMCLPYKAAEFVPSCGGFHVLGKGGMGLARGRPESRIFHEAVSKETQSWSPPVSYLKKN